MCESFGWTPPYFPGDDLTVDVLRIVLVLDVLGHEQGLSRNTVADYLTSAKHHYLLAQSLSDPRPSAWGSHGQHHPIVSTALKAIPVHHREPRQLLTIAWIKDGFERSWTTPEYVAIAFLHGWLLRVGEGCKYLEKHIITWSMITFSIYINGELHELPMSRLRTTPCDQMDLHQASRKYQEGPRLMPGRVNTCHLADPATGAHVWCHLCMPTIMQAWAIINDIDLMSVEDRQSRPVLAQPGTDWVISATDVSKALKRHALRRGESEASVSPHCLRTMGLTQLANSEVAQNPPMFLRAVGHKSMEASEPYVRPSPYMATAVTSALCPPSPPPPPT